MAEDYGSLSEEELTGEIQRQLDSHPEIDASDLEFKFEDGHLIVSGSLQTEEELEALVHLLENYMDPKDYSMEIEVADVPDREYAERSPFSSEEDDDEEEEEEEEKDEYIEEELEEFEEDEMEEGDDLDEDDFDDEKW